MRTTSSIAQTPEAVWGGDQLEDRGVDLVDCLGRIEERDEGADSVTPANLRLRLRITAAAGDGGIDIERGVPGKEIRIGVPLLVV
jgi:hypothetical protein